MLDDVEDLEDDIGALSECIEAAPAPSRLKSTCCARFPVSANARPR
jgi:hypothetical protein